jgi:pimeloyl-ACP methyl ester carboxylesterase
VRGKVGIYGRSIGGITACHLAAKYSDLVDALICDRTLSELQSVCEQKLKGRATTKFFELYTNGWHCYNPSNFIKANTQFKILMCDPLDDTVDLFTSLQAGIARELATNKYDSPEWRKFHESLVYICEYEDRLYKKLTPDQKFSLEQEMIDALKKAEQDLNLDHLETRTS